MTTLQKTIKRLAKKSGYPHIKLSHSQYYQILVKAHALVNQPKIKP